MVLNKKSFSILFHSKKMGFLVLWLGLEWNAMAEPWKVVNTFPTPASVQAITISADETMIAVAMRGASQESTVILYHRSTGKPMAHFDPHMPIQKIQFAPDHSYLMLMGPQEIQVWDLENSVSRSEEALPVKQRIFQKKGVFEPALQGQLSRGGFFINWIEGHHWWTANRSGSVSSGKSMWQTPVGLNSMQQLELDPEKKWIAIRQLGVTSIAVFPFLTSEPRPSLDYHHFPVVQIQFVQPNVLLSLDKEKNMIWGQVQRRTKMEGFSFKTDSSQEKAVGFRYVQPDVPLAILTEESTASVFAYLVDAQGERLAKISIQNRESLAASPTSRYWAAAVHEREVTVYQQEDSLAAEKYIRLLQEQGAFDMARRYRNERVPSFQDPSSKKKNGFLQQIQRLEASGDHMKAEALLKQMQQVAPEDSQTIEAESFLQEEKVSSLEEEASAQFELGHLEEAIRLWAQIPDGSPYYRRAKEQIQLSEEMRQKQSALQSVKTGIEAESWDSAEAQLRVVLAKYPHDSEALALEKQIKDHQQQLFRKNGFFWGGSVLALFLLALAGWQRRRQILQWLSMQEKEELFARLRTHRGPASSGQKPSPERDLFFQLLEKTKQMLVLSQKADTTRQYTALLIDLETELGRIQKQASDPKASFSLLTKQLSPLSHVLRNLKFQKKNGDSRSNSQEQSSPGSSSRPFVNYYEVLGVSATASAVEIKKAYHERLKEYHPDRHQSSDFKWVKSQAESMSRLIQEAYHVLSDGQQRQEFDQKRQKH